MSEKGGLSFRGIAFMTVLAVSAVLKSTLPSLRLSYNMQDKETTVTVLAASAVSVVAPAPPEISAPPKLKPPYSDILGKGNRCN